jgi:hypothetical protein
VVVHGRQPERPGGGRLGFLFFFPLAGHLKDEVERIVLAAAVIDPDDEVGVILALDVVDRVGDREAETLVLDLGTGRK